MGDPSKNVILTSHAKERMAERNVSLEEIFETLNKGNLLPNTSGGFIKQMTFSYNATYRGVFFAKKLVRLPYVLENGVIIVKTVMAEYS